MPTTQTKFTYSLIMTVLDQDNKIIHQRVILGEGVRTGGEMEKYIHVLF